MKAIQVQIVHLCLLLYMMALFCLTEQNPLTCWWVSSLRFGEKSLPSKRSAVIHDFPSSMDTSTRMMPDNGFLLGKEIPKQEQGNTRKQPSQDKVKNILDGRSDLLVTHQTCYQLQNVLSRNMLKPITARQNVLLAAYLDLLRSMRSPLPLEARPGKKFNARYVFSSTVQWLIWTVWSFVRVCFMWHFCVLCFLQPENSRVIMSFVGWQDSFGPMSTTQMAYQWTFRIWRMLRPQCHRVRWCCRLWAQQWRIGLVGLASMGSSPCPRKTLKPSDPQADHTKI